MATIFYERLSSLCEERNEDLSNVLKALNLSTSKGTAWKTGSYPRLDQLIALCGYFDVSMDYLCGLSDIKMPAEKLSGLSAEVIQIMNSYQSAPPDLQLAVKRFLASP